MHFADFSAVQKNKIEAKMATVDTLAAKYPKYKDISKFRQLATELGKENPKISYYCLFRIAEKLNCNLGPYKFVQEFD